MLKKDQKIKLVKEITDDINTNKAVIFVDYRGIKTKSLEKLRQDLKISGAAMRVVRKSLLNRAIDGAKITEGFDIKKMEGQIAVIFGDVLAAARTCTVFAKQEKAFAILGGILEGKTLSAKDAMALATIPSRHELLGQLVYVLSGPMRGLAVTLNAIPRSLVVALNEISKKKS